MLICVLLAMALGNGDAAAFQERKPETIMIRGVLRHHPDLEGGTWTLKDGKTVFDLHGNLAGRSDGEEVEIVGTPDRGKVCVHMVGIYFRLDSIRKVGKSGKSVDQDRFRSSSERCPGDSGRNDRSPGPGARSSARMASSMSRRVTQPSASARWASSNWASESASDDDMMLVRSGAAEGRLKKSADPISST